MAERVAFFSTKEEVTSWLNTEVEYRDSLEPNYNIAPGDPVPVLLKPDEREVAEIRRVAWGRKADDHQNVEETIIPGEEAGIKTDDGTRQKCVILLSGFYVWKKDQKQENPFFIRMLNSPVMAVGGLFITDGEEEYAGIVTTPSNPLIQPMSDTMPVLFDNETANQWLEDSGKTEELIGNASTRFLLTDLSVLRVSKNVNDPENNHPGLIQPIPK